MAAKKKNKAAGTTRAQVPAGERVVDSAARNDIVGVLIAVLAAMMAVAIVTESQAVVSRACADILRLAFGAGAILAPVALALFAATFFLPTERLISTRLAAGLTLIVVAILALLSITMPGAELFPESVLQSEVVVGHGGYVGASVAWLLLVLVGEVIGIIVLAGLIVIGIIVCGFSISDFFARVGQGAESVRERAEAAHELRRQRRVERASQRMEQQAAMAQAAPANPRGMRPAVSDASYLGDRQKSVLRRHQGALLGDEDPREAYEEQPAPAPKRRFRLPWEADEPASAVEEQGVDDGWGTGWFDEDEDLPLVDPVVEKAPIAPAAASTTVLPARPTTRLERPKASASEAPEEPLPPVEVAEPKPARAPRKAKKTRPDFLEPADAQQTLRLDDASPAAEPKAKPQAKSQAKAKAKAQPQAQPQVKGPAKPARSSAPAPVDASGVTRPDNSDDYEFPPVSMIERSDQSTLDADFDDEIRETAERLQATLAEFGSQSRVVGYVHGPNVTTFKIEMGEGERVNKITNLEDDIALSLASPSVRIFAPIPGTSLVGIEIPNKETQNVRLGDVLPYVKGGPLDCVFGRDAEGRPVVVDLAGLPHLLVAGTTGSGKSVFLNGLVMTMLMRATPEDVRLIMVDPKRVEFTYYAGLPHLYVPVVTEPRQAASALQWAVSEMERRLKVFEHYKVRDIKSYNSQVESGRLADMENPPKHMPYFVIVIDELSDLMMVAGKDVEASIVRIAQLGRAAGIHLIVATQRPSADVVTGLIKANIDNRVALSVDNGMNSRIILDQTGAERLLGHGDMLYKLRGARPKRAQGCFTSEEEVQEVVSFIKEHRPADYHAEVLSAVLPAGAGGGPMGGDGGSDDDPLVWEAARIVVESQLGSTSGLQRRLKVGYARAGRIMDMLEQKGVVGPPDGSRPREVLLDLDGLEELREAEARYEGVV